MGAAVLASVLALVTGVCLVWPAQVAFALEIAIGLIFAASVGYSAVAIFAMIGVVRDRAKWSATEGKKPAPPITLLKPVCGGEYALHADHERFAPAFFAPLYVARGDVRKELSMVFTLPGRIEGLAVDASGAPRAGIKIQLTGHDRRLTREAITNKTGRFVF